MLRSSHLLVSTSYPGGASEGLVFGNTGVVALQPFGDGMAGCDAFYDLSWSVLWNG